MLFRGCSLVLWFGPALEGVEAAAGPGFQSGEERVRTDGPADALAFAQARRRRLVLLGFQEVGEAGNALAGGGEVGKPVLGEAQKGARARPSPVSGPLGETGAHGIEVHIAVGGGEMVLVHRHGAVSPLPEMAGSPASRVDQSGVSTMHARQRAPQAVFVLRDEDEMDVVGHQTPRPNAHARFVRRLGQPVAVGGVVGIGEEHPLAAVAALRYMVGQAGDDDTGETNHG